MRKYSEKFINDSNILSKSKVGVEFEFFMKSLSYYKTLEILNQYLSPVKVWGFRTYHSEFTPDNTNFKLEPDLSGGSNMVELITGPLTYYEAKYFTVKILKFIQDYGYTNEKSSIHFNISFNDEISDKDLNDLNVLKLILTVDEDEIYKAFPSRKDNVYAKTIKKVIPYKEYDFNNISIEIVKNNIRFPNDKYFGVNLLHINNEKSKQRLEFRYIGGTDYEKNIGLCMYFMDKFIINTYNSIDASFTNDDITNLEYFLDKNISNFKSFSKYDNFLVEFPTIVIQVDQSNDYNLVNTYYTKLYNRVYNIVDSTDNLKDCILNYVTISQRMEVVDAQVKSNFNIKEYDFINCVVQDGIFEDCTFVNCQISNCQIIKSRIDGSELDGSKVLNCHVESSTLRDCFFMGGYLNSEMISGVFRSGNLGPFAVISSDTKMVNDVDNFFNTKFDTLDKSDKGSKSFKK